MLQHVSPVRQKLPGRDCDAITRRPARLNAMRTDPSAAAASDSGISERLTPPHDEHLLDFAYDRPPADAPPPGADPSGGSWQRPATLDGVGSASEPAPDQAHLYRMGSSRQRASTGDPQARNCPICPDAPSRHTFDTCTKVQRLRKEQPTRPLCEPCWAEGH